MPASDNVTAVPAFIIHTDGQRLANELEAQVRKLTVHERLDSCSKFIIDFSDPFKQILDGDNFVIGTAVKIQMGYLDSLSELISGEVTGMSAVFQSYGGITTRIHGRCRLHRLMRGIKSRAYTDKSASDIVQQLADEAGMKCEADKVGCVHKFTLQHSKSDYDYLLDMAKRFNCHLWSADNTLYFKQLEPNSGEDVVLEYGKTLFDFNPEESSFPLVTGVKVRGWDNSKRECFTGEAGPGDVKCEGLRLIKDSWGEQLELLIDAGAPDKKQADSLARNVLIRRCRGYVVGTGSCPGNTDIRAGGVLKIKGLAGKFSTTYFIMSTRHILDTSVGYTTWFEVVSNIGTDTRDAASDDSAERTVYKEPVSKEQAAGTAAADSEEKTEEETGKNPQITSLKWKNKDKGDISKALVGDEVYMTADVRNIDDGINANITVFYSAEGNRSPLDNFSTKVKNGKIEFPWTVTDPRHEDDRFALHYQFKIDTPSVKDVESGTLEVKNPRILGVEFNKKALFYNEELEVKISSFEIADFAPEAVIEVWEKDENNPDDFAGSVAEKIDSDEKTVKIKLDFDLEKLTEVDEMDEYELYFKVKIADFEYEYKHDQLLIMSLNYF